MKKLMRGSQTTDDDMPSPLMVYGGDGRLAGALEWWWQPGNGGLVVSVVNVFTVEVVAVTGDMVGVI